MLSSKYISGAKFENICASSEHGLSGTIDDTFAHTSILSDPIRTRIILSALKATNYILWVLLCRKDLNTM